MAKVVNGNFGVSDEDLDKEYESEQLEKIGRAHV